MHKDKLFNWGIVLLIGFTAAVMILQNFVLQKTLEITPNANFVFTSISDSSTPNGASTSHLEFTSDKILLHCNIVRATIDWPFCEISIALFNEHNPLGFDLSNYENIILFAKYKNSKNQSIRFQIRSFHPDFATLDNVYSWKYNGIEFWENNIQYPATIPIRSLQVATWWLVERNIPIEHSSPDLRHAMILEVSTGNNIPEGSYIIEFEKVVFVGKYISTKRLYAGLIMLWILAGLVLLAIRLFRANQRLKASEQKAKELRQLNQLLNIETQALKDQATRDPLTGALNRSGTKALFTQELKVLSLIFIDIDHFKKINDHHGHGIGDEVLQAFAQLLSENSRTTDFLARWGGEEFLLICPNTDLENATMLAEELRQLIEKTIWPKNIPLTASFGVAQRNNEAPAVFIDRADKALYAAKARGRNRVVVAPF